MKKSEDSLNLFQNHNQSPQFDLSYLSMSVRKAADVLTAVSQGDLSQKMYLEDNVGPFREELDALKENVNRMINHLRETEQKNSALDWLKTNLARFGALMQGQRSVTSVAQLVMSELTPLVEALYGTFFIVDRNGDEKVLELIASYAFIERRNTSTRFRFREGLVGQCAFEKRKIFISHPPVDYVRVRSSLGEAVPTNLLLLPVLFEGETRAVIELASFKPFSQNYLNFLDQLMESIGTILNLIYSSQELKKTNAELELQTRELEEKAKLLEQKNKELALASKSIEEKAEQLTLISKYKSEFLANMSHELRTPLNSLLILSSALQENNEKNLTPEQVKYASTIHSSGQGLLSMINEILDLSKVEAGKMVIDPVPVEMTTVQDNLEEIFRPVAESKNVGFSISIDPLTPLGIFTDGNRLLQILKNLIANAFKFTESGSVQLNVLPAHSFEKSMIAFEVRDTGIGIEPSKLKMIFEAFRQADGTTSRKYGGTGLGLTISRELASLLGGRIDVQSTLARGSIFTLYLPQKYEGLTEGVAEKTVLFDKRVLFVEKDMRSVFAMSNILEKEKMNIVYAETSLEALECLNNDRSISLVLTQPDTNFIRSVRQSYGFRELPIVCLVSENSEQHEVQKACLAAGASHFLPKPSGKPIISADLIAMVCDWLNQ